MDRLDPDELARLAVEQKRRWWDLRMAGRPFDILEEARRLGRRASAFSMQDWQRYKHLLDLSGGAEWKAHVAAIVVPVAALARHLGTQGAAGWSACSLVAAVLSSFCEATEAQVEPLLNMAPESEELRSEIAALGLDVEATREGLRTLRATMLTAAKAGEEKAAELGELARELAAEAGGLAEEALDEAKRAQTALDGPDPLSPTCRSLLEVGIRVLRGELPPTALTLPAESDSAAPAPRGGP